MTRYVAERKQETRSRAALTARLTDFGWLVDPIEVDIGEDLLVRVMDGPRFSGISFFVQLKSRVVISSKERKRSHYGQRVDVEHLDHWERSAVPVVLLTWDLDRREGCWVTIASALRGLNAKKRPSRAKTVRIPIGFSQTTADAGLRALRRELAHLCLPVVQKGRKLSFQMAFTFPRTREGSRQSRALSDLMKKGTSARIDGKYVTEFRHKGWSRKLFGDVDLPAEVVLQPQPSTTVVPIRLEVVGVNDEVLAAIAYVELRMKRGGTDQVTFSNEQQDHTVALEIVLPRTTSLAGKVSFTIRPRAAPVREVHAALEFGRAVSTYAKLRLVLLRGGQTQVFQTNPGLTVSSTLCDAVASLVEVQDRLRSYGTIVLPRGPRLSNYEIRRIKWLHDVFVVGTVSQSSNLSMNMKREGVIQILEQAKSAVGSDFRIELVRRPDKVDVFNLNVPVAEVHTKFSCNLDEPRRARLRGALAASSAALIPVRFDHMQTEEQYIGWERSE